MNIAIAGAGLVGRVLALNLLKKGGYNITLYDSDTAYGEESAGITAAGMLAVFAELESAESIIFDIGQRSIELWPSILEQLDILDSFQHEGTIITAHPQDVNELEHFISTLKAKVAEASKIEMLNREQIMALEPDLDQHSKGFYLPQEGQVDAQLFMKTSSNYLMAHPNVVWLEEKKVDRLEEGTIIVGKEQYYYDWVFDCRGLGSQVEMPDLRGVRGEVYWLKTDEVKITRPTRMLHPRYKIYIVPRPNNLYIIGATEIESEDRSEVSVRSTLEMLSAVYSMHPAFAEARIIKTTTNCRPAFKDNLPRIEQSDKLTRINGLYRHGYLMAPAIVEQALNEGIYK